MPEVCIFYLAGYRVVWGVAHFGSTVQVYYHNARLSKCTL
jgi:hypothetical protein